jgi:hypothetical protein
MEPRIPERTARDVEDGRMVLGTHVVHLHRRRDVRHGPWRAIEGDVDVDDREPGLRERPHGRGVLRVDLDVVEGGPLPGGVLADTPRIDPRVHAERRAPEDAGEPPVFGDHRHVRPC